MAGGLVFRHGANVLWMGSPDQIKDKREFYQPQMASEGISVVCMVIMSEGFHCVVLNTYGR